MDREKVKKGIKACWSEYFFHKCYDCPYKDIRGEKECIKRLGEDVLELLKEQEPILLKNQHKPYGNSTNANSPWISRCPRCGKKVEGKQSRFCKYCGQAVKWNE